MCVYLEVKIYGRLYAKLRTVQTNKIVQIWDNVLLHKIYISSLVSSRDIGNEEKVLRLTLVKMLLIRFGIGNPLKPNSS